MPRPTRNDAPGAYHHVMARGIAHRPIFETRADVRYFLSLLAWAVHSGAIEVHAYVVLTTHFHLLVRSLDGNLDRTMQWVLDLYARRFNRIHERDGSVFRDRYRARRIDDTYYWRAVVLYIDRNPVDAGLVRQPVEFAYGSARQYLRPKGPPWLTRTVIEKYVAHVHGLDRYAPSAYASALPWGRAGAMRYVLDGALERPNLPVGPIADLVRAAPAHVQAWLAQNALNADGLPSGVLLLDPTTVQRLVDARRSAAPAWLVRCGPRTIQLWTVLESGLLRTVSGLSFEEIAARIASSASTVHRHVRRHGLTLATDDVYARVAADVVHEGLAWENWS